MKNEVIRAEHIYKMIHGSYVLKGANLSVYEKEILGLVGLSGSGKSVIAEILSGIRTYESGQIFAGNQKLEPGNKAQAAAIGIYHIKEKPELFSCLTLGENICLTEPDFHSSVFFPSKRQLKTVREALRSLNIDRDLTVSVDSLTLYERHMATILRAYYLHARLIIIDNITNGYTQEEFRKLGVLLLQLKRKGISILFIESRPERVISFTDRIVILRNGRDEGILFRDEYEDYNIEKIMIGDYKVPNVSEKALPNYEKESLLSVRNICGKNMGGISFFLKKGEVIGIIDEENGTCMDVLRLFLGNADLQSGTIELEGETLNVRGSRDAMIHAGIGYVDYYKNCIFPKLSLCDNLTITSLDRLTSKTMINTRLEKMVVRDLLNRLEIPLEHMKKPLKDVSNNEQLVAALYKWILNRSRVVILNNVLSGTDIIMHNIVAQFLNELRRHQCGAILFSPNAKEIYGLCDRIYILRDGQVR